MHNTEWEKEFEERWVNKQTHLRPNPAQGVYAGDKNEVLTFIRKLLNSERTRIEKKIEGMRKEIRKRPPWDSETSRLDVYCSALDEILQAIREN